MLRTFVFLLLSLTALAASAQLASTDSLLRALSARQDERGRITLLNQLSRAYVDSQPDSALHYAKLASAQAEALNYAVGRYKAYNNLGLAYQATSDYAESLGYLERSLALAEQIDDLDKQTVAHNNIGLLYQQIGNYPLSAEYHIKSLRMAEQLADTLAISRSYNNLGVTLKQQGDLEKSLSYYLKCLKLDQVTGNRQGQAIRYHNIGRVYGDQGQHEEALRHLRASLRISQEIGSGYGECLNNLNIGATYLNMGEPRTAEPYVRTSLALYRKMGRKQGIVDASGALGEVLHKQGRHREAKPWLEECLRVAQERGYLRTIGKASEVLAEVNAALGNYADAYRLYRLHKETSDSLGNDELIRKIARIEAEYNFERQRDSIEYASERSVATLNTALRAEQSQRNVIVVGLVGALFVIFLLFRYLRIKQQANRKLETLNREKDGILGVASHDLRSPLSRVKTIVYSMRELDLSPTEREEMVNYLERAADSGLHLIEDLMLVHRLENEFEPTPKEIFELTALTDEVLPYHVKAAAQKNIRLHVDDTPALVLNARRDYLQRVLDNLLNNAVKFTPSGKSIYFEVRQSAKLITFVVRDEGPGIKKEEQGRLFQKFSRLSARPTGGESSTGLGLAIIKELAERLGGEVRVESSWGEGATFFFEMPYQTSLQQAPVTA